MSFDEENMKSVAGEMALPATQFRNLGVKIWTVSLLSSLPLAFQIFTESCSRGSHGGAAFLLAAVWTQVRGLSGEKHLGGVSSPPYASTFLSKTSYLVWTLNAETIWFFFAWQNAKKKKDHKIETRLLGNYWLCHWLYKDSYKVGVLLL